jgi:Cu(I)/Ag(I) efflux system membrane fusion protein
MKTKTILMITLTAVIGGGVLWLAPHRLRAADTTSASHKILYYTCPMHPSVKSDKPGGCPICGMNLVPVYDTNSGAGTNTPPTTMGTNTTLVETSGCCSSGGCH